MSIRHWIYVRQCAGCCGRLKKYLGNKIFLMYSKFYLCYLSLLCLTINFRSYLPKYGPAPTHQHTQHSYTRISLYFPSIWLLGNSVYMAFLGWWPYKSFESQLVFLNIWNAHGKKAFTFLKERLSQILNFIGKGARC